MTYNVLMGTLDPTHSLTHDLRWLMYALILDRWLWQCGRRSVGTVQQQSGVSNEAGRLSGLYC